MSDLSASRRNPTILIVDDLPPNRLLLVSILERRGYILYSTDSGGGCLSLLRQITPHLILLDIQMPAMDGFETCRRIRANPAFKETPIAFLTASKTADDVRAGMQAGGNDFITKPFDPKRLMERIEYWISRRPG